MTARRTGTIFWLGVILDHDGLDAVDKLLLIGLADHVDERDIAYPGLDRLARRAGRSYDTAKRRMKDLAARGYIERSRRHRRDGSLSTYEYRFIRDAFDVPDPVTSPAPNDDDQGAKPALGDPATGQNAPWPTGHPDALAEVPSPELEEEESFESDLCLDDDPTDRDLDRELAALVDIAATELLRLRDRDKPDDKVAQPRPWLAKARKRLRRDALIRSSALIARHPAAGCIGRPNAQQRAGVALAHVYRAGSWPERFVRPSVVASPGETAARSPMPSSVRAGLNGKGTIR